MCGLAGVLDLGQQPLPHLGHTLRVMNDLQQHRGPDGHGQWEHLRRHVGLAHRRLSIIDLGTGQQPMTDDAGNWLVFNGEIYNYIELRRELGEAQFRTTSDTEVILRAYRRWGPSCVDHLRGMFALALWDEAAQTLFCARDRFGIKPFCYSQVGNVLYFASEAKALLPFLRNIDTDLAAFKDYLTFQFCLGGKTLFKDVHELLPAHTLTAARGQVVVRRYWQVYYTPDFHHTGRYFEDELTRLLLASIDMHKRSDVPIGGHVSGGLDSSIIACLATRGGSGDFAGFAGKFSFSSRYDESPFAREVARTSGFPLHEIDIGPHDFTANLGRIIYHLDYPVAGPGSFPQYMVSRLAAAHRKVVLGGQGGDEIFGGYVRYLIAYFEQCIKAAIDGTSNNGNFIVTYESIIPNLVALRDYKPMLQEFWRDGLFEDLDKRYYRLINRAPSLGAEIHWELLDDYSVFDTFRKIFRADNVEKESYFDSMTHFDFKTLLPALLHVEDRVSMAHGLESRVPFLDHPLVEFAATMPSDIKFKNGSMKNVLRNAMIGYLPKAVADRKDKMGFPVPLTEWFKNEARDFVRDTLSTKKALHRDLIDNRIVLSKLASEPQFGRQLWGLLSLEVWQQEFHDRETHFQRLASAEPVYVSRHATTTQGGVPMKVLLTGGAGFVGSHLADRLLAQGKHVLVIDNYATGRRDNLTRHPNLTVVEASIAEAPVVDEAFARFGPDVVVHAAASYKDPENWVEDVRTNVLGTAHVVKASRAAKVKRIIYFQTALCYGLQPLEQPITLNHPIRSTGSSYAITKTGGEQYVELSGLDWVSFRLANAYGPRNLSGPLPTFYHRLTNNKPCFVTDTRRDFIYIDDLIQVVVKAVDGKGTKGVYHISSGSDYAIQELFDATVKAMGVTLDNPVEVRSRCADDVFSILLDPSKTNKDFEWKASTPLETGVAKAIAYYSEHGISQTFTHLKAAETPARPLEAAVRDWRAGSACVSEKAI
jgi:asparagine synthase (glutamine-hydrolysing)